MAESSHTRYPRMGHGSTLLITPSFAEIFQKQTDNPNPDISKKFYYAIPDLMAAYEGGNTIAEYDGVAMTSLIPPEIYKQRGILDALRLREQKEPDPKFKEQLQEAIRTKETQIFGNGYAPCTFIKLADTQLSPETDGRYEQVEETRRALNENGMVGAILSVHQKDDPLNPGHDTYLAVMNSRFQKNDKDQWEQLTIPNASAKLFAMALHHGIISRERLEKANIRTEIGLIPGLLAELEKNGKFTFEPSFDSMPTAVDYGAPDIAVSGKAFEGNEQTFELPQGRITDHQWQGPINAVAMSRQL